MENLSLKVAPEMPKSFEIPNGSMGPHDKDVMAQLTTSHPLQQSEAKYADHKLNINTQLIKNHHGMGAQLKFMMELNSVSKVGRLPFLPSSNIARDVLLDLDTTIQPSDIFGTYEFSEKMTQPHAVVEKCIGIL